MDTQKRFGKLTIDHLRHLIGFVPVLDQIRPELASRVENNPEKAAQVFQSGLSWGAAYDAPVEKQIAEFLLVAGLSDFVVQASKSSDPYGELQKLDEHPDYQEWNGGFEGRFGFHHFDGGSLRIARNA